MDLECVLFPFGFLQSLAGECPGQETLFSVDDNWKLVLVFTLLPCGAICLEILKAAWGYLAMPHPPPRSSTIRIFAKDVKINARSLAPRWAPGSDAPRWCSGGL